MKTDPKGARFVRPSPTTGSKLDFSPFHPPSKAPPRATPGKNKNPGVLRCNLETAMQQLTIEQRIEISEVMGAPVDGLADKAEKIIPIIEDVLRIFCDTPREATVIIAIAHLYFTGLLSKEATDVVTHAQDMLELVANLIIRTKE